MEVTQFMAKLCNDTDFAVGHKELIDEMTKKQLKFTEMPESTLVVNYSTTSSFMKVCVYTASS